MAEAEYIDCWFVGGPLKNTLRPVLKSWVERYCASIDAMEPIDPPPPIDWAGLDVSCLMQETFRRVTYFRSIPLETGTPVFSCLACATEGGFRFGLRSVRS